jgi:hypothetical protein
MSADASEKAGAEGSGELQECSGILKLATPHLYRRNLFRVLGLPVTATPEDVRRRQRRVDMQRKLGLAAPGGNGQSLALTPPPSDDDIGAAMDRLADPEARLMDEVFWFWSLNGSPDADAGLKAIERGQVKEASEFWSQQVKVSGHGLIATHNLAVLCHLAALDEEAQLAAGPPDARRRERLAHAWAQALERWRLVLDGDDVWSRVRDRVRELNDVRLTTGLVRRMRNTLPKALLLINATMACAAAERQDTDGVQRHLRIIREAKYPDGLADAALREALQPLRTRLKVAVDQAKARWTADPRRGAQQVRDLHGHATSMVAAIDAVLAADSPTRAGLHDLVAEAMLEGQVAFSVKTNDWAEGVHLLELARQIACGEILRGRLDEQIAVLRKNIEAGNDWCCPDYWTLADDTIEELEGIRAKAKAGDYEGALRLLLPMDPKIGRPLRRCVAYTLSQRGSQILDDGLSVFGETTTKMKRFLEVIERGSIRVPNPYTPSYALPPCPCCGSTYYSRWANGEYKGQQFWMCSSCSEADDRERERQRAALRMSMGDALEYVILASEVDPDDPGVRQTVKDYKELAAKIDCPVPTAKALKTKLGKGLPLRRVRRETLPPAPADHVCFFCGANRAEAACQIVVPMYGCSKKVEMLLHEGVEHGCVDVAVPRCKGCRHEHETLPARIEQWHAAHQDAGDARNFPDMAPALCACRSGVAAAEEAQAKAGEPRQFPGLLAKAVEASRAAVAAQARVTSQEQAVAAAVATVKVAEDSGAGPLGLFALWRRLRGQQPSGQRPAVIKTRRDARIAEAVTKLDEARRLLASAKAAVVPLQEIYKVAAADLLAAREKAKANAARVTAKKRAALKQARARLRAAQKRAMAAFAKANPAPVHPAGIKPEDAYPGFCRISELKQKGWAFGKDGDGKGKPSDVPVDVRGLVARAARASASEAPHGRVASLVRAAAARQQPRSR